jgi:hypothetical protein
MLLNILIFVAIILLIAVLTVILIKWLNKFFNRLSSRLIKTRTEKTQADNYTSRASLTTKLNAMLATFIGLLSLALCLQGTVLNADFVAAEIQKLDMSAVATEMLSQHSSDALSGTITNLSSDYLSGKTTELSQAQIYASESIEETLEDLWPSLSEQVNTAVYSVYDYFLGEQADLAVVIPLENLQESLEQHLKEAVLNSPPPELAGASQQQLDMYAETVYQQQFSHVPAEVTIASSTTIKYFSIPLSDIRRVTVLLPVVPIVLLGIVLLLILGVILADRNFKNIFWNLGITLIISTLVGHLYVLLAREAGIRVSRVDLLPTLNIWIIQVASDFLAFINGPFTIMLVIGGAMVLVALFFILLHKAHKKNMKNTLLPPEGAPV